MPEKGLWIRTYSARDLVPGCPIFTRAKSKLPSWDKYFIGRVTVFEIISRPIHFQIFTFFSLDLQQSLSTLSLSIYIYIYIYIYILDAMDKQLSKLCKNENNIDIDFSRYIYHNYICPVGRDSRIHRLHLCWGVKPLPTCVLDMTLNNLMVKLKWCWNLGECGAPRHCHRFQIHSGPK